jgi:subtilase family serine protease
MFCYNTVITPSYILNQIELEAKGYGIKNSIANLRNQLSCTSDATNVLEYSSRGRVLLILVFQQNLKPSSWRI